MHYRKSIAILLAVHALCISGCCNIFRSSVVETKHFSTGQPVDFYLSPYFNKTKPYRVVLIVPKCYDNNYELQSMIAEAIGRKLAELGTFQIVAASVDCNFEIARLVSGEFPERQLCDLANQYGADGVLFCETSKFSPYEPMSVGCSLTLYDTRELVVTMFAGGSWETANQNVKSKFVQHVCQKHRCKPHAAAIHLQSPREFFDFVANDLSDFISSNVR